MDTAPPPPGPGFDYKNQTIYLYLKDGVTPVPISTTLIDEIETYWLSSDINYATQVGACIMMLVVMLVMTPLAKLGKLASVLHILNLTTSIVRYILIAIQPISDLGRFYTQYTTDISVVSTAAISSAVAGITLGIVQITLIEAALMLQAWSLVQLFSNRIRWAVTALSALVALSSIVFKAVSTVYIDIAVVNNFYDDKWFQPYKWNTVLNAASFFYFTALFNSRLICHMWTHRSFLPSSRGLTAMEVLVMTNGILMILPCKSFTLSTPFVIRVV